LPGSSAEPIKGAEQGAALQRALAGVADWVGRVLAVGRDCGAVRDDLPALGTASSKS
jgi:hypothetical protein